MLFLKAPRKEPALFDQLSKISETVSQGLEKTSQGAAILTQKAQTAGISADGARAALAGKKPKAPADRLRASNAVRKKAGRAAGVATNFVGDLLGLDGVAGKTEKVVGKVRGKVENVIDGVVGKARSLLG